MSLSSFFKSIGLDSFKSFGQDFVDGFTSVFNWGGEAWKAFKHLLIPDMRRDREAMTNASTNARRLVYGRTRVGGQMIYAATGGDKNQYMNVIVVFASHVIDGYEELWYDDSLVAHYTGGAWVRDNGWGTDNTEFNLYDGTQTASGTGPDGNPPPGWTVDHKLLGCAYGIFSLTYNESRFVSGIPSIKVVMRGKKVYDPRTGLTAWSDNPALCIRDYMLLAPELGGMGCSTSEINAASIITAADICDQTITAAGGEKRYTLNGIISLEGTPSTFIKSMLAAMSGSALYAGGEWQIFAGAASSSVATIDESWLNGGISFSTGTNKNDRINTAKGTYTNPADHWADTEFPAVIIDAYVAADGEELTADLSLPFTNSQTMAQRIAAIEVQKSRYGMSLNYPCNFKAACLNAMDVVAINNTLLGWSGKLFRIMSWDFAAMGGVNLSLVEDNPAIWADPATYDVLTPSAMTSLPSPWTVAAPTGLTVVEELYAGNIASVIKTRLILSWTATEAAATLYDVAVNGEIVQTISETTYTINDVTTDLVTLSVRSKNSLGVVSAWTDLAHTVIGKSAPPPPPDSFLTTVQPDGTRQFSWSMLSPPVDLAGYQIRYKSGTGAVWADMTPLHVGDLVTSPYETNQLSAGSYTFACCAVDTTGNISSAKYIELTIGDPRLSGVAFSAYPHDTGWADTKTDCYVDAEGRLVSSDTKTWASFAADVVTWAGWTTWARAQHTPITYQLADIDLGAVIVCTPLVTVVSSGTATVLEQHSSDGSTWTGWAAPITITARYVRIKFSVAAIGSTLITVSSATVYLDAKIITETVDDVVTSALTGAYRIGTGNIRIPITKSYTVIKGVQIALQNVGAGWSWELIDKDTTTGPQIKIYNSSNTLADCTIDADVKGL